MNPGVQILLRKNGLRNGLRGYNRKETPQNIIRMGYRLPAFAISAASERTVLWIHVYIWQHIRAIVERAALGSKSTHGGLL